MPMEEAIQAPLLCGTCSAAEAAADQNLEPDSEEEEEEEETPRQSHSSRQRQTEGSSWLGCGLASTRTDDATSERRAAGTLSARSRI